MSRLWFSLPLTALLALIGAGSAAQAQQSSSQAELFLQLQQLQEEVARLRGLLEEQQNALSKLQRENLERYQSLERRLASAGANSSKASATPSKATDAVKPAAAPPKEADEPVDLEQEKLYYDAAFDLIKTRDFDQSEQALSGFLHRYPDSQYAANAQYWLGEVYLVKGQPELARAAFAKVVKNWPKHAKVPDALYKQADATQRLAQNEQARRLLREVIEKYPNSSAAKLAQRDLQQNP
ncbi:hypothetical protein AXE65_03145 [Ventosimonas gracilis]|uniref:Cell division coordinator CpoB n=1 Tax=Ventosimonas gracilis TaxID=1680762 RepID=A0A139SSR4_9GAMM|nr:tol-pal system protein YbgF [Ventosimonas gracilis]KXU37490.1 hypothetical protein AXE65_03145 [Ventosimonas gracilis]